MPSLDDVYRKFGETAEAAQLLETELGNMLLSISAGEQDLFINKDRERAAKIFDRIERQTLGQLLHKLEGKTSSLDEFEDILWQALEDRNRLFHHFYHQHNFRRNSEEGRAVMLSDLETMHGAAFGG